MDDIYDGLDERTRNELKLEAAEERIGELEQKYDDLMRERERVGNLCGATARELNEARAKVAQAAVFAEDVREALASLEQGFNGDAISLLDAALTAFRSPEPQPAAESGEE